MTMEERICERDEFWLVGLKLNPRSSDLQE